MNKIIYALFSLCLIFSVACTEENSYLPKTLPQEGEEVAVSFSTALPDYKEMNTRASDDVSTMHLLVFDEHGNFIIRKKAELSDQTGTNGNFTAMLPASQKPRIIHFISNYDWANFNDNSNVGVNEAGIVTAMSTENVLFWTREELNSGISTESFKAKTISLLRNQAKISVFADEVDGFELLGFTIHNTPNKGTIAPFNTVTSSFDEGVITEYSDLILQRALQNNLSLNEQFLFERKNATTTEITTVIVKGNYKGQISYYKIDLVDSDKNRYDVERNYHYRINVQSVNKAGYLNFEDALNGASHNNTALDPVIEKYPLISDGVSKLELEKTLVILTEPGEEVSVWVKYFPDVNSSNVDNSGVTVKLQSGNEVLDESSLSFDASRGVISVRAISSMPDEIKEARIVVSEGDLARTIRVVLRTPYRFDPVTINGETNALLNDGNQNANATLGFTIPNDFSDDLFPLPIKIYTQTLYSTGNELQMFVEQGEVYYVYMARSKGPQTIDFKTNKTGVNEKVVIKADYFAEGSASYKQPEPIQISGEIEYKALLFWYSVPKDANVSVNIENAFVKVTSKGKYTLTLPYTETNPQLTFKYNNNQQTIRLNELKKNPDLSLK